MQKLLVCAIAIDDVRDFFRADEALAARLQGIAAKRFARQPRPKRHLFPPLIRHSPELVVDPKLPDAKDLSALLSGGFITPDRMAPSWLLLAAWLEELSIAHRTVVWDDASFSALEWDLARAGLHSEYSLQTLADRQLGLQLRPEPGQIAGYSKHAHVADAYPSLREAAARAELSDAARAFVDPMLEVCKIAASKDRLDLVIVGLP